MLMNHLLSEYIKWKGALSLYLSFSRNRTDEDRLLNNVDMGYGDVGLHTWEWPVVDVKK